MLSKKEALEILRVNPSLNNLSEEDLSWLCEHGDVLRLEAGDYLFEPDKAADHLYIILRGSIKIYSVRGGQRVMFSDLEAGSITGVLPYSRMVKASGFGEARVPTDLLTLHRDQFNEMICERHDLTSVFVHHMTDRIRNFTSLEQQNEKLAALGKMSAGLAHELNNPAAAVVRSSRALRDHLLMIPDKFKDVMRIKVTDQQVDRVNQIMFQRIEASKATQMSLMERTEREDELADWLDERGFKDAFDWAETLAEFGFTTDDFERINEEVPDDNLEAVLGWVVSNLVTDKMVAEIADASSRISELVQSVKTYTHMDRSLDKQLTDLHEGIRSTVTMLGHKMRANKVELVEDFDSIPKVAVFPGEVNQVFTNVIDNAIDAMENGGKLTIRSYKNEDFVMVEIGDSGVGIPAEIQSRIFDPFFTTKDIGKGTGMGLDMVSKIMRQRHKGDVKVSSQPGSTKFTLCFPLRDQ